MKTGLDLLLEKGYKRLRGMRLGVLCNQASNDSRLTHVSRAILNPKLGLKVVSFFGPQHGVRGEKQDNMIESGDFTDPASGLPVYSLYGSSREPSDASIQALDALVVDLQDIGTRIYTFMYTLANCMRAAKKHGKKIIVLDRPNPIDGVLMEGNRLESAFSSFVGQFPIVTRHAMTMGELALMFNQEFGIGCDLEVVRLSGWNRKKYLDDYTELFVPPSPNIPRVESAVVFPGMVHFEGTNISEGRGTTRPFEWIGAPFIDPDRLASEMNRMKMKGVFFRAMYFQPTYQKWADQVCGGIQVHVTDRRTFNSFLAGVRLLHKIAETYPKQFQWKKPPYEYEYERMPIDLIAGTDELRKVIEAGQSLKDFEKRCLEDVKHFKKVRKNYLLYRENTR